MDKVWISVIIFAVLIILPIIPYKQGKIKRTLDGGHGVSDTTIYLSLISYPTKMYSDHYTMYNYFTFYKSNIWIFVAALAAYLIVAASPLLFLR